MAACRPGRQIDQHLPQRTKPRDLPPIEVDRITHFFEHYKDLEPGSLSKYSAGLKRPTPARKLLRRWNVSTPEVGSQCRLRAVNAGSADGPVLRRRSPTGGTHAIA